MEPDYDSEAESTSVATPISYESEEEEIEYHPEPVLILSGEGTPGAYQIVPWEEESDERVPLTSTYINVIHK